MESALLRLLGLSLAHLALLRHEQRMMPVFINGEDVIAACVKDQPRATASVVRQSTACLWATVSANDIPQREIKAHIDTISDLVRSACGYSGDLPVTHPHSDVAAGAADAIARAIVAKANLQPATTGSGNLDAQATLQSLFAALLASGPQLDACLHAATRALDEIGTNGAVKAVMAQNPPLAELCRQLATDTGISNALLEAIVSARTRLASPVETTIRTLANHTIKALELLGDLTHLSDRAGRDDSLEAELLRIASLVREGNLGKAGYMLRQLSHDMEGSDDLEHRMAADLTGTAFFPSLLAVRARLADLSGELREAARLYERAVDAWPREDRIRRWQLKITQARLLAELGQLLGAQVGVLCQAAQTYAAAGALICEDDCPLAWAEANLELGMLLLTLAHREEQPQRYPAAALHFKPAIAVFTRERAMDGWARAQIGLAHALRGQAAYQCDVIIAREAAFAYRAALGILTKDATPELWHHARCALGDCLVMIAEEAGDIESLQLAFDHLLPYLDTPTAIISEPAHSIGDIAMGRAMLFVVESGSKQLDGAQITDAADETVLGDTIALLKEALERGDSQLTSLERAHTERALGRAQYLYFGWNGRPDTLADAIVSKARARDLYEHIGNSVMADDIATEIETLTEIRRAPRSPSSTERSSPIEPAAQARSETTMRDEPLRLDAAVTSRP